MLMNASGAPLGPSETATDTVTAGGPETLEKTDEQKRDELLARPFLGVDASGTMTLHLPFHKTDELVARGIVDKAHSFVIDWYATKAKAQAEEQRKVAALAAKTGYGRFTDKLAGMLKR